MTPPLRVGSLFSGIGGFDWAARWMGWTTAWYSDIEPFPCAVMAADFPEAVNLGDITAIRWPSEVDDDVNLMYPPPYTPEEEQAMKYVRKMTPATLAQAITMYEQGMALAPIAKYFRITRQALWMMFRRRGVAMRPQQRSGEHNHFYRGGVTQDDHANNMVEYAVRVGILNRPATCESCGEEPSRFRDGRSGIQAHHSDYNKPLEVMWLCKRCHHTWHKTNTAIPIRKEVPREAAMIDMIVGGFP